MGIAMNEVFDAFPGKFFYRPGVDRGLHYITPPGPMLRRTEGATIRVAIGSDQPATVDLLQKRFEAGWHSRAQTATFEIATVPAVLVNAIHLNGQATTNERFVLNGAAGDRIINGYLGGKPEWMQRRTHRVLADARAAAGPVPVWERRIAGLPILIECRNRRNFYHFLTEALPQMETMRSLKSSAPILFQTRGGTEARYLRRWIDTLYPRMGRRVRFEPNPVESPVAVVPYNHRHALYQLPDPDTDALLDSMADELPFDLRSSQVGARRLVRQMSYDAELVKLRERGLQRLEESKLPPTPPRFIIQRDPGTGARDRGTRGLEAMTAALHARGFVDVCFDHLSPIEQIAHMAGAEMVVAEHGAALANMLFASPAALVVEIGTTQTQQFRWGDFLPNAHPARCTYLTVFCDPVGTEPGTVPHIGQEHLGVDIGRRAIDEVVAAAEAL